MTADLSAKKHIDATADISAMWCNGYHGRFLSHYEVDLSAFQSYVYLPQPLNMIVRPISQPKKTVSTYCLQRDGVANLEVVDMTADLSATNLNMLI